MSDLNTICKCGHRKLNHLSTGCATIVGKAWTVQAHGTTLRTGETCKCPGFVVPEWSAADEAMAFGKSE